MSVYCIFEHVTDNGFGDCPLFGDPCPFIAPLGGGGAKPPLITHHIRQWSLIYRQCALEQQCELEPGKENYICRDVESKSCQS